MFDLSKNYLATDLVALFTFLNFIIWNDQKREYIKVSGILLKIFSGKNYKKCIPEIISEDLSITMKYKKR